MQKNEFVNIGIMRTDEIKMPKNITLDDCKKLHAEFIKFSRNESNRSHVADILVQLLIDETMLRMYDDIKSVSQEELQVIFKNTLTVMNKNFDTYFEDD